MQERLIAGIVTVLLVLSGCAGAGQTSSDTPTTTATATVTQTPDPTTTAERSAVTPRVADSDTPDNPWDKRPIIVGIRYENDSYPDYSNLVTDAVNFWEREAASHATWEPDFEVKPNATDPDIIVEFKANINRCELDHPGRVAGCASVLRSTSVPEDPEEVEVVPRSTRYYTREILKHEFGHILGLRHGDEPIAVMDRSFKPFSKYRAATYHVHVEFSNDYASEYRSEENIGHALDYYESGGEGWAQANLTFEFTEDEGEADIRIEVSKGSPAGSYVDFRARTIHLQGLIHTRHGWHVGYWIGFLFGADDAEDLPPAFDEPKLDDRTDWW